MNIFVQIHYKHQRGKHPPSFRNKYLDTRGDIEIVFPVACNFRSFCDTPVIESSLESRPLTDVDHLNVKYGCKIYM